MFLHTVGRFRTDWLTLLNSFAFWPRCSCILLVDFEPTDWLCSLTVIRLTTLVIVNMFTVWSMLRIQPSISRSVFLPVARVNAWAKRLVYIRFSAWKEATFETGLVHFWRHTTLLLTYYSHFDEIFRPKTKKPVERRRKPRRKLWLKPWRIKNAGYGRLWKLLRNREGLKNSTTPSHRLKMPKCQVRVKDSLILFCCCCDFNGRLVTI